MRVEHGKGHKRITISPGEYYVSNAEVLITTLLGSCVSACLYDPRNRIVGMNHFLLSNDRYSRNMPMCITEAGRYGIHSMELLINKMMTKGAERGNLKAKAFGGGSVIKTTHSPASNFLAVGEINVRFIKEFLSSENIPLVASDLGGFAGRVIYFDSRDFSVHVRKMAKTGGRLTEREERYWERAIKTQKETETEIDLW